MRDKVDVCDFILGLSFINVICLVEYKWDFWEDYKEVKVNEEIGIIIVVNYSKDGLRKRNRYYCGVIV